MKKFSYEVSSFKIADFIRKKIIFSEDYKSGDRISESEIANELDISKAPVREAFKELKNQGLITSIPEKGNFVIEFNDKDIEEILEIRILFEHKVFEALIEKECLAEDDLEILIDIVDEMVKKVQKDDEDGIAEINRLDMKFHAYLWGKSGRKWMTQILVNLHYQLQLAMVNDLKVGKDLEKAVKIHYEILDSLKKGDLTEAQEALMKHIKAYNGRKF